MIKYNNKNMGIVVRNKKRNYISFYLVLMLLLIISILAFIILINVGVAIPSKISQQISLQIYSIDLRNINSLLAAKAENIYDFEVPIVDLIIAATFFDGGRYSKIDSILLSTNIHYKYRYDLKFDYCTDVFCSDKCEIMYLLPTAYGEITICNLEFEFPFGHAKECGTQ